MSAIPPHAPPVRMGGSAQSEIVRSTVDQVRDWARSAALGFLEGRLDAKTPADPDWPVTVDAGLFIGYYPDTIPDVGQAIDEWSSGIGVYLDVPGVAPLPEQRVFGTVIVPPWGATEELVTGLVIDALTRMYRDRTAIAVEGKKRLDDLATS